MTACITTILSIRSTLEIHMCSMATLSVPSTPKIYICSAATLSTRSTPEIHTLLSFSPKSTPRPAQTQNPYAVQLKLPS
eukprot:363597-Chlamydomonas_euryale.AAC.3